MTDNEEKELQALISLLEDPNDEVYVIVEKNLFNRGIEVVPKLEAFWESTEGTVLQQRIENLIQNIQFNHIKKKLKSWSKSPNNDLLEGAYWVAKYQYPELDYESLEAQINLIVKDIKNEINTEITPLEKIKTINHIFFEDHKYTRNTANYHSPQNSFINQLIETKKGNSVSLGILYSIVARRLGIPIQGVNLPINFILAYMDERSLIEQSAQMYKDEVIFYINPFNRGAVLGKKEIDQFIIQQKLNFEASYYLACDNNVIIKRLLTGLKFSYEKLAYPDKVTAMSDLLAIFNP